MLRPFWVGVEAFAVALDRALDRTVIVFADASDGGAPDDGPPDDGARDDGARDGAFAAACCLDAVARPLSPRLLVDVDRAARLVVPPLADVPLAAAVRPVAVVVAPLAVAGLVSGASVPVSPTGVVVAMPCLSIRCMP